jgi:DNA polymerase I-like protein with 3'-5' exonuclease and polymerase domains
LFANTFWGRFSSHPNLVTLLVSHGDKNLKIGILDVESTIYAKGNPFAERNRLVLVGIRTLLDGKWVNRVWPIEYLGEPYADSLEEIRDCLAGLDVVVGFNLKFDLNWLARYGIVLPTRVRIFDCQLAEFILDCQRTPFPSLDMCLAKYGLGSKLDTVEREYWAHGIDTDRIPVEVLVPYLETDLEKTHELYIKLQAGIAERRNLLPLIQLHMQDLRVLQEMEFNGILFDWQAMATEAAKVDAELDGINQTILSYVPEEIRPHFNTGSGTHLSALLYGGILSFRIGTPYQHTYKGGQKAGQTETRYRWEDRVHEFPQRVDPPEDSDLKKEGIFSVDEETLLQIKNKKVVKELVGALLRRSELEKLSGTYYHGIPATCEKYDWKDGYVHGTFNQCRVVTGRLSSEKPNQQNFPDPLMKFIVSRFDSSMNPETGLSTS